MYFHYSNTPETHLMLRVEVEYLFVLFHVHFGGLVGEYGEGRQILDGHGVFGTGRFGSCRDRGNTER